jgi:small subunit ribosomal protein S6
MAFYEVTFVARPDLNNSEVEALAAEFAEIVTSQGGKIVKQEFWGLRKLAYLINKNSKGHYVFFGLDCDAPTLHELERKLRLNESVMRNLTIKVDAIEKDASAPIRQDDEKEYNAA